MPYHRYSISLVERSPLTDHSCVCVYVCINRKRGELKSDLDFGFPLGGSTRVRLLAVSRQCAYLPVPEIAIDTHRTVRLCRLQPILRITIGSMLRSSSPSRIRLYSCVIFPATLHAAIPLLDFSPKHPPLPTPPPPSPSYFLRKEESRCITFIIVNLFHPSIDYSTGSLIKLGAIWSVATCNAVTFGRTLG